MKRLKFFILLLLISTTAISQEKGSYLTISGGLGFQGFKYSPKGLTTPGGYNNLCLGWNSGVGYSYFFTKHFGFSLGVGMSYFHSQGGYNVKFAQNHYYNLGMQIDDDFYTENPNMPFELRARVQDWKEIQTGYTFDIPLMFLFQNKFGEKKKHGIYVGLGAKIQIPFISTYFKVVDSRNSDHGKLNISGYYPDWHMEVAAAGTQDPQVPQHGYGTIHNPNEALGWHGDARVKTSYSAAAEIGFLYTISPRVDFMYGLYLDYGLNNIKADGDDTPLMQPNDPYHSGYPKGEHYVGKGIAYNGLMNSDRTDHIDLLSYGAKIGLRIRLSKSIESPEIIDQPTLIRIDTVYIYDTVYIHTQDTIEIEREVMDELVGDFVLVSLAALDKQTKDLIQNSSINVLNNSTNQCVCPIYDVKTQSYLYRLEKGQDYTVNAKSQSYLAGEMKFSISSDETSTKLNKEIELEKLSIGQIFVLNNIYYDYDKYNIREDAAIELNKLVKIMVENPTLKIELSSHTDSRGSDEYNMRLSQNRAESAVKYIINKGISADRITAKGYGETKLVNECSNGVKCSDAQHQENRRTEVLITDI